MEEMPISLVINAGGLSRRMGRTKALLPLPPDNTPLVVAIMNRLLTLVTDRVVVVSNDQQVRDALSVYENTIVLTDKWQGGGALGGVATGLGACLGWAMVVACDMPLVDQSIFNKLISIANSNPDWDAVIPLIDGMGQPFHGLWHHRALQTIDARLANGELGVQEALRSLNVAWVDERMLGIAANDIAFINVNTPGEWQEFLANLQDQKGR